METEWMILFPDKNTVDSDGSHKVRRAGHDQVLDCGHVRKCPTSDLYQYFHGNTPTALLEDADFYKLKQKVLDYLLRKYSQPADY